tara:strand:- start:77 stop:688 length:612 start_codon:yes stop_codon:yes gene_type:complete
MPLKQTTGSRAQVMHGTAKKTTGGLTKSQLKYNNQGKIVSKKASALAKKNNRLVKAGFVTQKGKFGVSMRGGGPGLSKMLALNNEKNQLTLEEEIQQCKPECIKVYIYDNKTRSKPDVLLSNTTRFQEFIKKYCLTKLHLANQDNIEYIVKIINSSSSPLKLYNVTAEIECDGDNIVNLDVENDDSFKKEFIDMYKKHYKIND